MQGVSSIVGVKSLEEGIKAHAEGADVLLLRREMLEEAERGHGHSGPTGAAQGYHPRRRLTPRKYRRHGGPALQHEERRLGAARGWTALLKRLRDATSRDD